MSGAESRRSFIKRMLAAAAACGAMDFWLLAAGSDAASKPRPQGIRKLKAEVRVNGVPASVGMTVNPGDVITTGHASHAAFVIGASAFLLKSDAEVQIARTPPEFREMFLKKGGMLSVFERGVRARVVTATAVAGVRGTGMYVEIEPVCTYICLCYGEADLDAVAFDNRRESLKTRHHEAPRLIYGPGASEAIVPAKMKNHTDGELIMLEALVGRTPAFISEGYETYY